ncbi:hypothetical protein O3P69_009887 [Scylla paramamosain]|uniref:Uncharacterized protein n=1 Tax=Scylla paramamosain TaxID=85552 RepID=A0AAW0SP60_SCYPA
MWEQEDEGEEHATTSQLPDNWAQFASSSLILHFSRRDFQERRTRNEVKTGSSSTKNKIDKHHRHATPAVCVIVRHVVEGRTKEDQRGLREDHGRPTRPTNS